MNTCIVCFFVKAEICIRCILKLGYKSFDAQPLSSNLFLNPMLYCIVKTNVICNSSMKKICLNQLLSCINSILIVMS